MLGLLFVPAMVVNAAENRGVSDINYELSADYSNADTFDSYAVNGRLSIPIQSFGGVSLTAGASSQNADNNGVDADRYAVGVTAFIRDYEVGKLSAGFGYSEAELDFPNNLVFINTPDDKIKSKQYTAAGEYYFQNITARGSRDYFDTDNADSIKIWSLSLLSYWKKDTRFRVSSTRVDGKYDYGVSISHQPGVFKNSVELSLGYSDTSNNNQIYLASVSYHFSTRVSLIERDRRYR